MKNFEYVGCDIWQLLYVDEDDGSEYSRISIEAPRGKIPNVFCLDRRVEKEDIQTLVEFIYNLTVLP